MFARKKRVVACCLLLAFSFIFVHTFIATAQSEKELIRVAVNPVEPFVFLGEGDPRGFSIDLWDAIANEANIEYQLVEVENVSALIAAVEAKEVDLGIGATTINASREEIVDFSLPFFSSGLQILALEEAEPGLLDRLRSVFNSNLLGFLAAAFGILLLIAHVAWFLEKDENADFQGGYWSGIGAALYWTIVTASTVGYGDTVLADRRGKFLAVVWMLLSLFLVSYFTATVTTSLTLDQLVTGINGPNDLANQRLLTLPGTTSAVYLSQRGLAFETVSSVDAGVTALKDGSADALIYDAPVLQYAAFSERGSGLRLVPTVFQEENYGIVMQPDSPLREEVNKALLQVQENGVYDQISLRWFGQ